jgi:hypothetical protein
LSLDERAALTQVGAMRGARHFITALLVAGTSGAARADDPQICADRPGKSTSPCTVPGGHFQVETAFVDYSLKKDGEDRETLLTLGETTVKYGLTDHSDIELDVTPWARGTSRSEGSHQSSSGFGDINLIYKHAFTSNDAALQISAYPFLKVPTAKRPAGNGEFEGGLVIPVQYKIGKSPFSIAISPELDWLADSDGHGHHAGMVQVAEVGWQATPKLNLSAEIFGQWDWQPGGTERQASFDVAAAYVPKNDLQLDAGANLGLNRATPDVEVYVGIAKQF